jgi:hypothetical protein
VGSTQRLALSRRVALPRDDRIPCSRSSFGVARVRKVRAKMRNAPFRRQTFFSGISPSGDPSAPRPRTHICVLPQACVPPRDTRIYLKERFPNRTPPPVRPPHSAIALGGLEVCQPRAEKKKKSHSLDHGVDMPKVRAICADALRWRPTPGRKFLRFDRPRPDNHLLGFGEYVVIFSNMSTF